ncbi:MAG: heme biosynthesis HemY N-terminal domain-containing protein [Tatlockia sp.]|jgi:HemY protein
MTRLLFIFILLLASVFLGIQLRHDPGYLLVTFNTMSIETTVWVAAVALVLLFFLLHTLLILVSKLGNSPATFKQWQAKRRIQKAHDKTQKGLIEFSEGHWSEAKENLIDALPDTDSPLLNYLTAARAAQELGDNQLRDDYLREAQQSMPDAKIAVELTQAQLQLANKQWEQALATLRHLQSLAPKHPYVLKLLMQLYKEVKDWPQLIALLPDLKKNKVVTRNGFERLQHQTYLQAMSDIAKQGHAQALSQMVARLPKNLAQDPALVAVHCQFLIATDQSMQAETLLRHCLKKQFNEELIHLYGQVKSDEQQLVFAESLVKKQPHSAALCLCIARLSLQHHLWGKARNYLDKSIHLGPMPETYEELGGLLERLHDETGACIAYRKGLALATRGE